MYRTIAIAVLVGASSVPSRAQVARVGRLPLLAALAAGASCTATPASATLRQKGGLVRILNAQEPGRPRLLSLGVTASGEPRMLMVTMNTRDGSRGEGEAVTVFWAPNGTILRGDRSAYTMGTPARRSEDRRLGLMPNDSAQAQAMARALLRLCRA
jgi:hypothetical protein